MTARKTQKRTKNAPAMPLTTMERLQLSTKGFQICGPRPTDRIYIARCCNMKMTISSSLLDLHEVRMITSDLNYLSTEELPTSEWPLSTADQQRPIALSCNKAHRQAGKQNQMSVPPAIEDLVIIVLSGFFFSASLSMPFCYSWAQFF